MCIGCCVLISMRYAGQRRNKSEMASWKCSCWIKWSHSSRISNIRLFADEPAGQSRPQRASQSSESRSMSETSASKAGAAAIGSDRGWKPCRTARLATAGPRLRFKRRRSMWLPLAEASSLLPPLPHALLPKATWCGSAGSRRRCRSWMPLCTCSMTFSIHPPSQAAVAAFGSLKVRRCTAMQAPPTCKVKARWAASITADLPMP
mmetsp:Transcript_54434/g.100160  ORF Transcript_54434/g.100160 Transcript_54434/m.100160 type:complete len:205 (-) Transcript_54434:2717-3331(-)